MYKCINCLRLLNEIETEGWVFEKGIYIEPGTGARIHLGICNKCNVGPEIVIKNKRVIAHSSPKKDTINNWLPIYDYIIEFQQQH
ncbi:hypothetical protein BVG16_27740 [Paenibacillus selenitireducens]|uniref:DUF3973 domain-containing protein n=2 Tax=Paenibacillus selenitireducens TaxID=1324314 RepID=A0A1T2X133_9BACL|nr:hypothetical protein BVG16_27740 [Paenibacillus selenitireducens]